jgi:hypothetical protein
MSDQPDSLVLELLRALRIEVAAVRADTTTIRREHGNRLTSLGLAIAACGRTTPATP